MCKGGEIETSLSWTYIAAPWLTSLHIDSKVEIMILQSESLVSLSLIDYSGVFDSFSGLLLKDLPPLKEISFTVSGCP